MRYTQKSLDHQRETLAKEVAKGFMASELAGTINQLAFIEGYLYADATIDMILKQSGFEAAHRATLSLLTRGADDRWSGRRNDVARSYFDGVRDAVRDAMFDKLLRKD